MVRCETVFYVAATLVLAVSSGCHVLVRLGEPPSEYTPSETVSGEEIGQDQDLHLVPPENSPETFLPPLPGLDVETDMPPLPGLDDPDAPPLPGLDDDTPIPDRSLPGLLPDDSSSRSAQPSPRDLYALRRRINGNTGINTNTAIAPGEGQTIYRTQLRFLQSHGSPTPADVDINVLVNPQVLAYGVRENLTLFGVVPLVKRDGTMRPPMPAGALSEVEDFGVGDMRFFAKYRFWEKDEPGETTRWSVFSGLEVPS